MSLLMEQVSYPLTNEPLNLLLFGVDGIGKTSFALEAPKPVVMGPEKGIPRSLRNRRIPILPRPGSFKDVLSQLERLATEEHDRETLVIDSLDWIEPICWQQVCDDNHWKTMEDVAYGKSYVIALKYWQDMIHRLSKLRDERAMNIIIIAHSQVKLAKDPVNQTEYDRYQLKLNEKAAALFREFVDGVLFANFEVHTHKDKTGKVRALGEGARYLYTERRPGFDAKNRFGLPFQIPLSWEDFMAAYQSGTPEDPQLVQANIQELAQMIPDAAIRDKTLEALKKAGTSIEALEKLQNRLRGYVGAA